VLPPLPSLLYFYIPTHPQIAATKSLASQSPALSGDSSASLLAPFADVASVNLSVALAVLDQALREGVAQVGEVVKAMDEGERREWARGRQWRAEYREYEFGEEGEGV
jgi:malic enzyme